MRQSYTYEELVRLESLPVLEPGNVFELLGLIFETARERNDQIGLEKGIGFSEKTDTSKYNDYEFAIYYYYTGNAWGYLQRIKNPGGPENSFVLESVELSKEIICLRKALAFAEKAGEKAKGVLTQILTNLGNAMDHVGRFIEAISFWDKALAVWPNFGMATGSLGFGLAYYARVLYDEGHRFLFCQYAYYYLLTAAKSREVYAEARQGFLETAKIVEDRYGRDQLLTPIDLDNFSLGRSKNEIAYRQWCITHSLFINPLNDFIHANIVAHDVFFLPKITAPINQPPVYHTIYNQLKQEYASARFLFYESVYSRKPHFSDRDNLQMDTLDYAVYSLSTEKMKIAFRLCYSLFDKIAYLINEYFKIGLVPSAVSFKQIWYQKKNTERIINPVLMDSQNWALRGLYWLSKDLVESNSDFALSILPDAQQLSSIRNYIEHKSFRIVEIGTIKMVENGLTMQISRSEMEEKTMVLMKMVRAAIMYLSFAINIEEQKTVKSPTVPIQLVELDHKFKQ